MDVNFIPSKTPLIRAKVQILPLQCAVYAHQKSLARASLVAPPELRTTLATSLARARKPSRPLSLHRPPEPMMTRPRLLLGARSPALDLAITDRTTPRVSRVSSLSSFALAMRLRLAPRAATRLHMAALACSLRDCSGGMSTSFGLLLAMGAQAAFNHSSTKPPPAPLRHT